MEPEPVSASDSPRKGRTPWGVVIGLVLILAIVVAGAYYSFTKRYEPAGRGVPVSAQSY